MKTRPKKATKPSLPNLPPQLAAPTMIDVLSAAIAHKVAPLVTRGLERSQLDREITPGGAPGLQARTPQTAGSLREPAPLPTVDGAMDQQEKAVSHLHDVCNAMTAALDLVLEPEGPTACGAGVEAVCPADRPAAPMIHRIRNLTSGVEHATQRLMMVLGRIQLGGNR